MRHMPPVFMAPAHGGLSHSLDWRIASRCGSTLLARRSQVVEVSTRNHLVSEELLTTPLISSCAPDEPHSSILFAQLFATSNIHYVDDPCKRHCVTLCH